MGLRDLLGSASRTDCDEYAALLANHFDGDGESPAEYNRRLDLERTLPETVRTVVESGYY